MKIFLFLHFEPADERIAIRGLESKIISFKAKNKKKHDEFQLYGLANDFNQNHISVESIEITPKFMDLIQNFPSVLYNPTILSKIKKISLANALKLESHEYSKQSKFTQEIVNRTIGHFITLCEEVNFKNVKIVLQLF